MKVMDAGDHRTIGIMSFTATPGFDAVINLMTCEEAIETAIELIRYATAEDLHELWRRSQRNHHRPVDPT